MTTTRQFCILAFAICTMLSLSACKNENSTVSAKDSSSFDIGKVKAAIAESNKAYSEAMLKGDSTAFLAFYSSDAHILPPNMPAMDNPKSVAAFSSSMTKAGFKLFNVESTDVYGNADLVVEEGKYSIGMEPGKVMESGKYIIIWKQENGKWKMYRDIYNPNTPPPPPAKK